MNGPGLSDEEARIHDDEFLQTPEDSSEISAEEIEEEIEEMRFERERGN